MKTFRDRLQATAAFFLAPNFPGRFYELYRRNLALASEKLPVLDGLPEATVEVGYWPALLGGAHQPASATTLWDMFAHGPKLLLIGPVGAGKSTLLRALANEVVTRLDRSFVQLLTLRLFGQAVEDLLPLWVDLRRTEKGAPLYDALANSMAPYGFPKAATFLRERLQQGQVLVLLDGLDLADDARVGQLRQIISTYPHNLWLVTSRPSPHTKTLDDFVPVYMGGLAGADISKYIAYYVGARSAEADGLLAACERSEGLAALAQNPLMLATMCRTIRQKELRATRLIPLLDACLEMLLLDWGTKAGLQHRYALKDKLRFLQAIAYAMEHQRRSTLDEAELRELIAQQLAEEKRAHADGLCEEIVHQAGVLVYQGEGQGGYAFLSPILQSHLAARWAVNNNLATSLVSWADDPRWHDTLVLVASSLADPHPFLQALQTHAQSEPYRWFLLAHCLAELRERALEMQAQVTEALAALLEGEEERYWRPAAVALAGLERRSLREHLTALIRDPDPEARRRAAVAMGRLHPDWAVPVLASAIADPEISVREKAAWALGYIPLPQGVRVVPRALHSPFENVRRAAAEALVRLSRTPALQSAVVQELIAALDDENEDVALTAEEALWHVGPGAMPQLVNALNDRRLPERQRNHVAKALGHLGEQQALPHLIQAMLNATSENIEGYVEAIAGIGAEAVPALIAAFAGRDVTTSAGLVAALAKIGAPAVAPLIEAISGSGPEIRNAAARTLEQIGAPAVEPLTQALIHDQRIEVRRKALEILGHIGESYMAAALIQALNDRDLGVRQNAVRLLGDQRVASAVEPLIALLTPQEPIHLRKAVLASLGAIGEARALPTLITVLEDPWLRESAADALAKMGAQVAEPLVQHLHATTNPETRRAIWQVLTQLGAVALPAERSPYGLASTYAKLQRPELTAEEILGLVRNLSWWRYGPEIIRSLETAHALATSCDLRSIGECGPVWDWITETEEWLRPPIKDILWGLKDVAENVRLYHTQTRRESQRDALLSAIDRLEEVARVTAEKTLPFEQAILQPVIAQWHAAILEGIKSLRGRASLLISLLTPRLPMRATQHMATAVFNIFNEGDSAARNVSVTIKPSVLHGIEIVGGERRELAPLGIGEGRQVEIPIAPHGVQQADLLFEVHYDDDEREGITHQFSGHIEFWETPTTPIPIVSNPYIVGTPVKNRDMFVGRQDIFDWVRDNISGAHQENVLLLYGERRMGKTSVLYQLLDRPPTPQHLGLLFDLQLYSYINTIPELFFELSSAMVRRLRRAGLTFPEPIWDQFQANPHRAFLELCNALDEHLGDLRLLIMLDEFGVLIGKVRDQIFQASLFDFLRGIIQRTNKISFLFTGAYEVRRMQKDYGSILFNLAKVRKISYLEPGEASELIERPMAGVLSYHPLVIQKIHAVTACHPYFVQYICAELVQLARTEQKNYIELTDLDYVLRDVVRDATGNIENSIYDQLGREEKLALAALANVTDDVKIFVSLGEIATMLERRGLGLPRENLMQALRALEERDLVTEMRIGQQLRYAFRMGLVRMWLRQNEILLRLSQEQEG